MSLPIERQPPAKRRVDVQPYLRRSCHLNQRCYRVHRAGRRRTHGRDDRNGSQPFGSVFRERGAQSIRAHSPNGSGPDHAKRLIPQAGHSARFAHRRMRIAGDVNAAWRA